MITRETDPHSESIRLVFVTHRFLLVECHVHEKRKRCVVMSIEESDENYRFISEMSSASPFTCITCHVAFVNGELQRAHYKSDWHRYNLKRKVADLGPITAEEFSIKVESIQQQRTEKSTSHCQRVSLTCKDCGKVFTSENGFLNHTQSKKHLDTVAKNANHQVNRIEQIRDDECRWVDFQLAKVNSCQPTSTTIEGQATFTDKSNVEQTTDDVDADDDDDWNDMDDGATATSKHRICP
jgi:hypothetical protein